jgi:hypothetical protein
MDLLIDFGASNLKYLVYSKGELVESGGLTSGSSKFLITEGLVRKANCKVIKASLNQVLSKLEVLDISRIFLCSEMHGITIADEYFSWMSLTYPEFIDSSKFLSKTGLKPWSGLPVFTIEWLLKNGKLIVGERIGDFNECILDISKDISNITLFSSTGLIDLETHRILEEYRGKLTIPKVTNDLREILGYIKILNVLKPVYFGIGDLQAVLYGAGYLSVFPIVINMGTGSQIALPLNFLKNSQFERRIHIDGTIFPVITHIPSGRVLNTIANFQNENEFWAIWSSLTLEDVLQANDKTYKFKDFGYNKSSKLGLVTINENYSQKEYIADLARWYCLQYVNQIKKLKLDNHERKIALTGGISSRSTFVREVLAYYLPGFQIEVVKTKYHDATLDGMIKLVNGIMS